MHYSPDFCSQSFWCFPKSHGEVGHCVCLESPQAVLEAGVWSLYLLSILTVRERAAFLSAWLCHSAPCVMVALTLQSDPSEHPQLSHVPAADKSRSCDSEEHILQIPDHASWKSFCDHKWTGGPASFHGTSGIPTVAGRSKHLSPS